MSQLASYPGRMPGEAAQRRRARNTHVQSTPAIHTSDPEAHDAVPPPLLARLRHKPLPSVQLPSTTGQPVDLADVDRAVLYLYPGATWTPEDGYDSPALDEAQHRAFAQHWHELLALRCMALGVSSQSADEQSGVASALGIGQPLLCDGDGHLARELGLPMFCLGRQSWYCRLTAIVDNGVIVQVFCPVGSAVRSPARAVAWMRCQRWL